MKIGTYNENCNRAGQVCLDYNDDGSPGEWTRRSGDIDSNGDLSVWDGTREEIIETAKDRFFNSDDPFTRKQALAVLVYLGEDIKDDDGDEED